MFVYIRSAAFIIVVTQKLVLQQSKYVTAKCTETLLPPPSIQFSLGIFMHDYPQLIALSWSQYLQWALLNFKKNLQDRLNLDINFLFPHWFRAKFPGFWLASVKNKWICRLRKDWNEAFIKSRSPKYYSLIWILYP